MVLLCYMSATFFLVGISYYNIPSPVVTDHGDHALHQQENSCHVFMAIHDSCWTWMIHDDGKLFPVVNTQSLWVSLHIIHLSIPGPAQRFSSTRLDSQNIWHACNGNWSHLLYWHWIVGGCFLITLIYINPLYIIYQ